MTPKTATILLVLKICAWIALVGYCIECGSQIISLVLSLKNQEASKLIPGMHEDLTDLYYQSEWQYTSAVSFGIALSAMKAFTWYLVIQLFSTLNLGNPFSRNVTDSLEKIACQLIGIWIVGVIGRSYTKWFSKTSGDYSDLISTGDEFFFIASIVYIISQIFKRGIELQEENRLTV